MKNYKTRGVSEVFLHKKDTKQTLKNCHRKNDK
jgi:hypothetical protein